MFQDKMLVAKVGGWLKPVAGEKKVEEREKERTNTL